MFTSKAWKKTGRMSFGAKSMLTCSVFSRPKKKSIDLTRLPVASATSQPKKDEGNQAQQYEYSSREVKPAVLLLQDLLRAHRTFLLHHDSSMSALFMRIKRAKFTSTLGRYWDLFLSTWNVLLHGNPIQDVFGGIKVAASGELGIGVGEEDRGSGERAVLEDLVGRIDGLVDLVVCKFGDSDPENYEKTGEKHKDKAQEAHAQWLGTGKVPDAEDGAIFMGVGALSRKSVCDITYWMEDMYTWGENAYGCLESPKAATRRTRRTLRQALPKKQTDPPMQIPPSLFEPHRGAKPARRAASPQAVSPPLDPGAQDGAAAGSADDNGGGLDKYMDYLKLGYGKYWSLGGTSTPEDPDTGVQNGAKGNSEQRDPLKGDEEVGRFLIGLTGEVEEGWAEDLEERRFAPEHEEENARNIVRTLVVELEAQASERPHALLSMVLGSHDTDVSSDDRRGGSRRASFNSQDRNKTERLRVVVYVAKPFIFTLLFRARTESLAFEGLYRSLHHQIAPLRKSLIRSTTYRLDRPDMGNVSAAIYDLVWDPKAKTVHSTIPNIPEAAEIYKSDDQPPWSRIEALNTHMQILNLYKSTRLSLNEVERTAKTSRGWWVVWNRVLERNTEEGEYSASSSGETERPQNQDNTNNHVASSSSDAGGCKAAESNESLWPFSPARSSAASLGPQIDVSKEIFLIRKASDHAGHSRGVSLAAAPSGIGWTDGASRLAQGIGVDTRKYIEGLLSLNL